MAIGGGDESGLLRLAHLATFLHGPHGMEIDPHICAASTPSTKGFPRRKLADYSHQSPET